MSTAHLQISSRSTLFDLLWICYTTRRTTSGAANAQQVVQLVLTKATSRSCGVFCRSTLLWKILYKSLTDPRFPSPQPDTSLHCQTMNTGRGVPVYVPPIAGTHCAYPRRDVQAELTWVAGLPRLSSVTQPSSNRGAGVLSRFVDRVQYDYAKPAQRTYKR